VLAHHDQGIGQHIQGHGEPAAGHTHHEFMLFQRVALIVKD
jgi:hypothetical protein